MSILDDLAALGRPQFFNGQRLAAADLQGLEQVNREMRWLHNQSLHQPGVGNGYAVTGNKGDTVVTVGPGYGIDFVGHELVMTAAKVLPVPPVAGEQDGTPTFYDLTISYPADADLQPIETRTADCCNSQGVVRLPDSPNLCWVLLEPNSQQNGTLTVVDATQLTMVNSGQMIVIARIQVLNCQLNAAPDVSQRRSALPQQMPFIAAGQPATPPKWDFVMVAPPPKIAEGPEPKLADAGITIPANPATPASLLQILAPIKLAATISTKSAGFVSTPNYTARLAYAANDQDPLISIALPNGSVPILLSGSVNIKNPQSDSFDVEVLLVLTPFQASVDLVLLLDVSADEILNSIKATVALWSIVWMGVDG